MIVIEDELASQNWVGGNIALDQRNGAQKQNGDFGTKGFAVNPEWMEGDPLCYGNVEGRSLFCPGLGHNRHHHGEDITQWL